jgi:hypothetical protein
MSLTVDVAAAATKQIQAEQALAASEEHAAGISALWIVFYTVIAVASLLHHYAA